METLTCYIDYDPKFNTKQIIGIFPNISTSNIYIQKRCNLIIFINIFKDSKVITLAIIYKCNEYIKSKLELEIILNNIKYLKIKGNQDLFIDICNKIHFPNLKHYELNLELNYHFIEKINLIDGNIGLNGNDFKIVNLFIIEILKDKNLFFFEKFFNIINQFTTLKNLKINLEIFSFIYEDKKGKKNYFEFKIKKENVFKN